MAWATEVKLEPAGTSDFGSGASVREDLYYPGGIPKTGIFLGHPNQLFRRDRALFRYDLSPFLLAPEKVKKAEFCFTVDYTVGAPDRRKVRVEHFLHPLEELTGEALADPDVETVQVIAISAADCARTSKLARPKTMDVTRLIEKDLEQGFSSVTFRFLDETVEGPGGPSGPNGTAIVAQSQHLPELKIDLEK